MENFKVFWCFSSNDTCWQAYHNLSPAVYSFVSLSPAHSDRMHNVDGCVHCTFMHTCQTNALSACVNSINWQQSLVKKKLVSIQNEDIIDHFCGTNNYCFTLCPLSLPFCHLFHTVARSICTAFSLIRSFVRSFICLCYNYHSNHF